MQNKKVLNFGSLNIDHVYQVKDFVRAGETIQSLSYNKFAGGKGLNQSIALARANAEVIHAGRIGSDGRFLLQLLADNQVDTSEIEVIETENSGHAMIQVSEKGQNSIVLFGGANQNISEAQINRAMKKMQSGDYLLLQNEISKMSKIIESGAKQGLKIFFNPAPMTDEAFNYPLNLIDTFVVNETEAVGLSGVASNDYQVVAKALQKSYPNANILMTLGANGVAYLGSNETEILFMEAPKVAQVVDTTAAGDTFIGYFLATIASGLDVQTALSQASKASGLCIQCAGAAPSIPYLKESMLIKK